jgi:hypothetical protein
MSPILDGSSKSPPLLINRTYSRYCACDVLRGDGIARQRRLQLVRMISNTNW